MSEKYQILEDLIVRNHFDGAILMVSPNFEWLMGVEKHLMERPTVIFAAPGKKPALVLPGFELNSMAECPVPFEAFPFNDNPAHWGDAFKKAGEYMGLAGKRVAVEPLHLRYLEYLYITNAIPGIRIEAAQELFAELRLRKSADDEAKMRRAAVIAQDALTETLKMVKPGVTERQISAELVSQLLRAGSSPNLPFNPIVAGGPNSADPHAEVSDRPLERGDFLLIDWGARFEGYCSDLTRTFVIGEATDKQKEIYNTVLAANLAGLAAVRPGARCGDADRAARQVIEKAGYGAFFTHRLGHGLGMECHEEPYIFSDNDQLMEVGMCFSDEPGIYLPDWGGVRIEDDVIVTADGGKFISDYPKELRIL